MRNESQVGTVLLSMEFTGNWIKQLRDRGTEWENRAREAFLKLRPDQLDWRPDKETWSIAQEFHHLVLSNTPYLRAMNDLGAKAGPESKPYKPGFWGKFLLRAVEPDGTFPAPVPKPFIPSESPLEKAPVEEFFQIQDQINALVLGLPGKDLNGKLSSPVSSFIKLKLGDAVAINATHNERHLLKAFRMLERPEFPK